jgi:hypothetical protein
MPKALDAIGWKVCVYWKDDQRFYDGIIRDFDAATGKHRVSGDGGGGAWYASGGGGGGGGVGGGGGGGAGGGGGGGGGGEGGLLRLTGLLLLGVWHWE